MELGAADISQTGANADEWVPVRPGTDGVLALGGALFREREVVDAPAGDPDRGLADPEDGIGGRTGHSFGPSRILVRACGQPAAFDRAAPVPACCRERSHCPIRCCCLPRASPGALLE